MFSKFSIQKIGILLPLFLVFGLNAIAQPKPPNTLNNPLALTLVIIMVMLALAIALLANVVNNATAMFREKLKKQREEASASVSGIVVTLLAALIFAGPLAAVAQDAAHAVRQSINGLAPFVFYLLIGVIAVEIFILIALVYQLRFLIGVEPVRVFKPKAVAEIVKPQKDWWWKLNKSHDIKMEAQIDLNKDYDGITELDNKLPPWWTVAFALTILFSVGYIYRYHIGKTAPLQHEELQIAIAKGEAIRAAYMANNANNVDENTVVMLDAAGIAGGKALFDANCVACHGAVGQGNEGLGPNLTDEYWIHGGSLSDIFRVIKYGAADMGMRSWKDDFSPVKIAQLTSYIRSLRGTNPPGAKAPQGELYIEQEGAPATDSTSTVKL